MDRAPGEGVIPGNGTGHRITMDIAGPRATAFSFIERADHGEPSVFVPANMLREARRQRSLPAGKVPDVCFLDPDGDIVRHVVREARAERSASWACYHTELWEFEDGDVRIGIIGSAVGALFAVLVAEELFASGCRFLVSMTSAGQIAPDLELPCVILIDRRFAETAAPARCVPTTSRSA